MNPLPFIMLGVCAVLGAGVFIFTKIKPQSRKKTAETAVQASANEFVNVKDIRGNCLYTRDGMAIAYLRVMPISIDLFSKNEKRMMVRQLTAGMSGLSYPFKMIAVSRPVDISPLLSDLSVSLTATSDLKQKELLRQEISEMTTFALSGEVVERQFYIVIWDKTHDGIERELLVRLKNLSSVFSDSGIRTEILQAQDIIRLCNLVNNPSYSHLEDADVAPTIPILSGLELM